MKEKVSSESLCSLTNSALNYELVYAIVVGINSLMDNGNVECDSRSEVTHLSNNVILVKRDTGKKQKTQIKVRNISIAELQQLERSIASDNLEPEKDKFNQENR